MFQWCIQWDIGAGELLAELSNANVPGPLEMAACELTFRIQEFSPEQFAAALVITATFTAIAVLFRQIKTCAKRTFRRVFGKLSPIEQLQKDCDRYRKRSMKVVKALLRDRSSLRKELRAAREKVSKLEERYEKLRKFSGV